MSATDSMPRTVVWVGVVFTIGGSLFIAFAPSTLNALLTPNTETWQSASLVLGTLVQISKITLAPLGAVLIGPGWSCGTSTGDWRETDRGPSSADALAST